MQMMRRRSKKKLRKFDVVVMESVKFLDGVKFFGKALRGLIEILEVFRRREAHDGLAE